MEAIETKLKQLKEVFSLSIPNMELEHMDEDWEEELLTQRYFSGFEKRLESLCDNQPELDKEIGGLISSYGDEVHKKMPKDLHHELAMCIQMDFELIAAYLISGVDNKYIAGMFLSYAVNNEIPLLNLRCADISLEDAFQNFVDLNISPNDKILGDFHNAFLNVIVHMKLQNLKRYIAESYVSYREHNQFEPYWIKLYETRPVIGDYYIEQIKNNIEKLLKKLPENIYYDLACCICDDYEIIATYLINGKYNSYIVWMCLSYLKGEIPMVSFDYGNKTLEEAFMKFKMMMKMGEILEKFYSNKDIVFD